MAFTEQQIMGFRCPRWHELPGLSLYMDQVVLVLEEVLGIFADDKERVLTATMVNNYVKQKLLRAPEKKKYDRDHLALLVMITVLKKVLSMGEIEGVVKLLQDHHGQEAGYDLFCTRLEQLLAAFFAPGQVDISSTRHEPAANAALDAALTALCGKLLTQYYLQEGNQSNEKNQRTD